jgi:hypothetical protein
MGVVETSADQAATYQAFVKNKAKLLLSDYNGLGVAASVGSAASNLSLALL